MRAETASAARAGGMSATSAWPAPGAAAGKPGRRLHRREAGAVTATGRLDAIADAAALVRSAHEHDLEGRQAILAAGDQEAICQVLASVLARVLLMACGGCRHCLAGFISDWQDDVRCALAAITEE
jgi:hypothetical protein